MVRCKKIFISSCCTNTYNMFIYYYVRCVSNKQRSDLQINVLPGLIRNPSAMSLHRGAVFGRRLLASCTTGPLPLLPTSSFISSGARLKSTGTPVNMGVMFVPQQEAWLVERMGKFNTILEPGLNFLIPILDKVLSQKVLCSSTGGSLYIHRSS